MFDALFAESSVSLWALSGLLGLAVLLLVWSLLPARWFRDAVSLRVATMTGRGQEAHKEQGRFFKRSLAKWAARRNNKEQSKAEVWENSQLQDELARAGFPGSAAVPVYRLVRVAGAVILPIVLWFTYLVDYSQDNTMLLLLAGGAIVGYMPPSIVVQILGRHRTEAIQRELPEVLDLLVVSVEAGLGLDAAMSRVTGELVSTCPILSKEFALVARELRAGESRERALRNMGARCPTEDVAGFVLMLIQADRFGVGIGRSLRVLSDSVRTKRRQHLEEVANRLAIKLLFPLLLMIFPAIILVMAGPSIMAIKDTFF